MTDYLTTLKKVGTVLIVVGILDIAVMIYCISNRIPYSSSLNIFAVIGGIFLYGGSLRAAKVVAFFSAFLLGAVCTLLLIISINFVVPLDLIITFLKLNPRASIAYGVLIPLIIVLLFWTYKQLTAQHIASAMEKRGVNTTALWKKPKNGLIIGISIPIIVLLLMSFSISQKTKANIISEAIKETDNGYKYFISSYNISNSEGVRRIKAKVIAYNDNNIKEIMVSLEE